MRQLKLSNFQKRPGPKVPKVQRDQAPLEEDRETEKKKPKTVIEKSCNGVSLSAEQSHIVDLATAGHHIFFTGPGGVGKSLTLLAVIQALQTKHGKSRVFVTASTGIAACNIGGTTLHSFAGVGLGKGTLENMVKKVRKRTDAKMRWSSARVLIVDEISMIDPEFFETLDLLARRLRPTAKHLLFGGIQIILAGDFLQLPYVARDDAGDARGAGQKSPPFLFETKTWKLLFPDTPNFETEAQYGQDKHADNQVVTVRESNRRGYIINLTRVFRQRDQVFVNLLHAVRLGQASAAHLEILRARVGTRLDCSDGIQPTRLYPHRADVQRENNIELHQLSGEIHSFSARETGDSQALIQMDKQCQAPRELHLKIGAQVVLLRNLDFGRRLVNGSRGVVVDFVPNPTGESGKVPEIKFANGITQALEPAVWEIESGGQILCTRTQIPLALCWASSIHKAMGMTLDKVETKLDSVFEYGQLYTALSRVTSLDGLSLLHDFDEKKIMAHPRVVEFYRQLDNISGET